MFHPTRDGCRGAGGQFRWEDIKKDKHRMNYLGNSVKVPHHAAEKSLYWYVKEQQAPTSGDLQNELKELKEKEDRLLGFYLNKGFGAKLPEDLTTNLTVTTTPDNRDVKASSRVKEPVQESPQQDNKKKRYREESDGKGRGREGEEEGKLHGEKRRRKREFHRPQGSSSSHRTGHGSIEH